VWLRDFLHITKIERTLYHIMSQLDDVLSAITTLTATLTTDVDALITLIQNGDPGALAAAQAIQASLQSLDTAVKGAEPQAPPPPPPSS